MSIINSLSPNNYYGSYASANKQTTSTGCTYIPKETETTPNSETLLGSATLTDKVTNKKYELKAACENEFTPENPVIKVTVNAENDTPKEYLVNIKEVHTNNASEIEMFALCTYADACNNLNENTLSSWNSLKSYIATDSSATSCEQKLNWNSLVEKVKGEYMDTGLYKQVMDGNQLIAMFEKYGYQEVHMVRSGNVEVPYKNITEVMDIDCGYAGIEFWHSGEIHYRNCLNEESSWTIEVTQEQLQKALELASSADGYKMYMSDKSFWENYLNRDMSLEELKEYLGKIQSPKTYQEFIDAFSDSIKTAWENAKQEAGTDGFGMDEEGNIMYLTEFAKMYLVAGIKEESTDLFGSSEESILELAKEILDRLNASNQPKYNRYTQALKDNEKLFYEKFIENLTLTAHNL